MLHKHSRDIVIWRATKDSNLAWMDLEAFLRPARNPLCFERIAWPDVECAGQGQNWGDVLDLHQGLPLSQRGGFVYLPNITWCCWGDSNSLVTG